MQGVITLNRLEKTVFLEEALHAGPVLVKNGELPSLRERLPEDPIVVVPIDQIGKHGGTASLFQAGEQLLNVSEGPLAKGG